MLGMLRLARLRVLALLVITKRNSASHNELASDFCHEMDLKVIRNIVGSCTCTLNQGILVLEGKKREEKEYSEGLHSSFVRY